MLINFGHLWRRTESLEKTLMLGKTEGGRRRGRERMKWLDDITDSMDVSLNECHLILCHPLFLLPPIPPSIRVFSNESNLCMRWPKYWSFSFSIIPSKKIPGLISFRMDWLDVLAVQVTLKSLFQNHSQKHQFFGTQLSSQFNSHIHT